MNTPSSEPQTTRGQTGKSVAKANKACVPCRVRKVKCDAATIGIPCSSCTIRESTEHCTLLTRKVRTVRGSCKVPFEHPSRSTPSKQSPQSSTHNALDGELPHKPEAPLLYLNILNDAVKETTESSRQQIPAYHADPGDSFTPRNFRQRKLPRLDDIDNEYLVKKGIFDLPPPHHLDTLVKIYFDYVHPFTPIINRNGFIRQYQSGDCSLFLLRVGLTPATIHAPADVLSACGFTSRSAAQESFFTKARLLYDSAAEDDLLVVLQGAIILCTVILDHPSDRDFGFWFHTAIGLATKLDLHSMCSREEKPRNVLKVYRRIWWALYSLDIFHIFANTKRIRLLENTSTIKPRTEDDWDAEHDLEVSSGLISPVTLQQRALPIAHCELSRIVGHCLSTVKSRPQQDPRQIMRQLDAWRKSLASKMHLGEKTESNVYYLNLKAMSYRFECILCRLIRRCLKQSHHVEWSEWAKQRLRSAILELDTIAMRVLASGALQDFPISFVTTVIAVLALHIETALDQAETQLVRSMAQISISQTMLILTQGKEIPAIKRALPVFEEILAKKNLYLVRSSIPGQVPTLPQSRDNSMANAYASPLTEGSAVPSQREQLENNPSLYGDFIGLDSMDDWISGNWTLPVEAELDAEGQVG